MVGALLAQVSSAKKTLYRNNAYVKNHAHLELGVGVVRALLAQIHQDAGALLQLHHLLEALQQPQLRPAPPLRQLPPPTRAVIFRVRLHSRVTAPQPGSHEILVRVQPLHISE